MSDMTALGVLVLLLVGNAYFVAAEFAMVAARRDHVEPAAANGSTFARMSLRSVDELSNSLATTQLGITACSLIIGAVGEPALAHLIEGPLESWGVPSGLLHPIALVIALLIVTFLHMVFGEMVPKSMSIARPGPAALLLGPPLRVITIVFRPLVWLMNTSANAFVRHVLRETPTDDAGSTFTVDQLRAAVYESNEKGSLDQDETALITGAIEFQQRVARDAMTPLGRVVSVPGTDTVAQVHRTCVESGFSRLPVRGHDEEFVGYVHVKDLLEGHDLSDSIPATEIRRMGAFDADTPLREVMERMRRDLTHVASVCDPETGEIEGITSLADVLRDIAGPSHATSAG